MLAIALGSLACESTTCVEEGSIWLEPPASAFTVCGDLMVTGRRADELEVLQRLEAVEGSLVVVTNPELTKFLALPVLARIGGSLSISNNVKLVNIDGFPSLVNIGGGVYVGENPALTTFVLGDALKTGHSLFLALNPRLSEFRCSLVELEDDLTVSDNDALEVLELPALTAVAGNFDVSYNTALRDLQFPVLRSIGGAWNIQYNWNLGVLAGFPSLVEAAQIEVSQNPRLSELTLTGALTGCEKISILSNQGLERIYAEPDVEFSEVTEIGVTSNISLKVVQGFAGVTALENMTLEGNTQLGEIAGFASMTQVSNLRIVDNDALAGPDGWFESLKYAGSVSIYKNQSLPPSRVDTLLSHLTVDGATRIGDNKGEDTALDPCPWPVDRICDAEGGYGSGTGLCASDPEDCGT